MCLAIAASDPRTAERLAMRLTPGTTWVSHLLQRLTLALVTDGEALAEVRAARDHYAERNAAFARRLSAHGLPAVAGDGLNLWVRVPVPARTVTERLMRRGWLARPGDEFVLADEDAAWHLRLTVHDLDDEDAEQLAADLSTAAADDAIRKVG
jgi:DNA-binding transcriptional MocR family regulator